MTAKNAFKMDNPGQPNLSLPTPTVSKPAQPCAGTPAPTSMDGTAPKAAPAPAAQTPYGVYSDAADTSSTK